MAATKPIRNKDQLKELAQYYLNRGQIRNYTMIIMGVHTVLRISDLLRLKWSDVYDEKRGIFLERITVSEKKTGKSRTIALNEQILGALRLYLPQRRGEFIFASNRKNEDKAISRVQAWRIIHEAVTAIGLSGKVSCHSLRKTWEYHACRNGKVLPVVVMTIYNHSNFETTKRYLGIAQDDLDKAYLEMELF